MLDGLCLPEYIYVAFKNTDVMNRVVVMLILLVSCAGMAQAQSSKEDKVKAREERRAEQARLDSLFYEQSRKAIEERSYVLEADRVVFKHGENAYVSSNTNFVMLDGDNATVQVAFNVPFSGLNGIGGVTVDGAVSAYEAKTDKNGDLYIKFNVMGTGISARVDITLPNGSSNATVMILPNFNSNRLTLIGHILPLQLSNVYKGRAL